MKRIAVFLIVALMASAVFGQWTSRKDVDLMYGTSKIMLVKKADIGTDQWGNSISLVIRLDGNYLESYIVWGDYLYTGDYHRVTTRFDDTEPESGFWCLSTNGVSTFYNGDATYFVKLLLMKKELYASTIPYSKSPSVAKFVLIGLAEELQKYSEFNFIFE